LHQISIQNSVLDRFSRKKASEIFESLNLFKKPMKKSANPPKPLSPYFRRTQQKKTKEQEVMDTLKRNSHNESSIRRSSCLNTMNLIPNAYKNKNSLLVVNDSESDDMQEQIKTSVEKHSTKIFGIDKLVQGRIQQIFGKGKPQMNLDFLLLKKNPKKHNKRRRKQRTYDEISEFKEEKTEKSLNLQKKLSHFDQKKFAPEHEKLKLDLYNYKVDELRGDLIENDLDNTYSHMLEPFTNQGPQRNYNKYMSFDDDNPMYELKNRLDSEERIYKKASQLISKIRNYESDQSPHIKKNDVTINLNKNEYYIDQRRYLGKLPVLKIREKNSSNGEDVGNKNTNYSSGNFEAEFEEKVKFNSISNFIEKSCFEEHKNNRVMIKKLKGKKRGIVGALRSLTNKLGVLNNIDTKMKGY